MSGLSGGVAGAACGGAAGSGRGVAMEPVMSGLGAASAGGLAAATGCLSAGTASPSLVAVEQPARPTTPAIVRIRTRAPRIVMTARRRQADSPKWGRLEDDG